MTLLTDRQLFTVICAWGYCRGNMPTQTEPQRTYSIPQALHDTGTRALATRERKNGTGQWLYSLEVIP